jgi:hypothetical protein
VILMLLAFLSCGLAYAVAHVIQDRTARIVFDALTLGFFCVLERDFRRHQCKTLPTKHRLVK